MPAPPPRPSRHGTGFGANRCECCRRDSYRPRPGRIDGMCLAWSRTVRPISLLEYDADESPNVQVTRRTRLPAGAEPPARATAVSWITFRGRKAKPGCRPFRRVVVDISPGRFRPRRAGLDPGGGKFLLACAGVAGRRSPRPCACSSVRVNSSRHQLEHGPGRYFSLARNRAIRALAKNPADGRTASARRGVGSFAAAPALASRAVTAGLVDQTPASYRSS